MVVIIMLMKKKCLYRYLILGFTAFASIELWLHNFLLRLSVVHLLNVSVKFLHCSETFVTSLALVLLRMRELTGDNVSISHHQL